MLRKVTGFLIILITFLIQTCLGRSIALADTSPNLLIIVTVSMGFLNGKKSGILAGFVSGIFLDIFSGLEGVIGFNALIFMYIGLATGWFNEMFYDDDIKLPLILIFTGDFIYNFIYYVIAFLLRNRLDLSYYMTKIIIPEIVYTTIVAVIVYKLLFVVNSLIIKHEKKREGKFV